MDILINNTQLRGTNLTIGLMAISIATLGIVALHNDIRCNDIQNSKTQHRDTTPNDIKCNGIQHNDTRYKAIAY
jgi:hypothetical protein